MNLQATQAAHLAPELAPLLKAGTISPPAALRHIALSRWPAQMTLDELWTAAVIAIETGEVPYPLRPQIRLGQFEGRTISLCLQSGNRLNLYDGQGHSSKLLAIWGRDYNGSGGKWSLIDAARRHFEEWCNPKPVARKAATHHVRMAHHR